MVTRDRVLIVEDQDEWQHLYRRAAERHGIADVRVASNLAQAAALIDAAKFSVAFIDIGLDVNDESNVDGLGVMAKIRDMGDETSIVVVTGRSGKDALPIARDSLKKYDAFDTVGKTAVESGELTQLLVDGLAAYKKAAGGRRKPAYEVLRGRVSGWDWDYEMLRATEISGGVQSLYGFLEKLVADFVPVIPPSTGDPVTLDQGTKVAYGSFWSRGAGVAILICFGNRRLLEAVTRDAEAGLGPLGKYGLGERMGAAAVGTVDGIVFAMPHHTPDNYRGA
jgi:CheY-like chemotaxis protein